MTVKEARKRMNSFQAKSSKCPVCHRNFRNGCDHSVVAARNRLQENLVRAIVQEELSKV